MRNILNKILTSTCAAIMSLSCTLTALADGSESSAYPAVTLPSGLTIAEFAEKMNGQAKENTDSETTFASAEVGIFRGGETLYTGYFGKINYEDDIPADENSVYEWGSISKTFIWVSAMQLREQGKLDLDRDVREYLPDGFFQHLSYDEPITMLELMDHTAGWQETTRPLFVTEESEILPLKESLQAIEPAQINRPGEVAAYSNYGAAVAGYVIECVSGMDYSDYVRKNIFEPLGMEHTSISPDHSDCPWVREQRKLMHSYSYSEVLGMIDLGQKIEYIGAYPCGAAIGTLADLMTYARALSDKSAPLFQNKETMEKMYEGSVFYGNSDIPMWSHGFGVTDLSVRIYGHSGATHACQADMEYDPETGIGMVVMVNEPQGNIFLETAGTYCFGEDTPDNHVTSGEKLKIGGGCLVSRSIYRGMFKFHSYISAYIPPKELDSVGDGVYMYKGEGLLGDSVMLLGSKRSADGSVSYQQPSIELKTDKLFVLKLCLLTAYVISAIAGYYMLRITIKKKRSGRQTAYAGAAAMTAGQAARSVSAVMLIAAYVILVGNGGGIGYTASAVIGVTQAVCGVMCAGTAVWALIAMRSKKERFKAWRYIAHAAINAVSAAAIVYYEMYVFTGI